MIGRSKKTAAPWSGQRFLGRAWTFSVSWSGDAADHSIDCSLKPSAAVVAASGDFSPDPTDLLQVWVSVSAALDASETLCVRGNLDRIAGAAMTDGGRGFGGRVRA